VLFPPNERKPLDSLRRNSQQERSQKAMTNTQRSTPLPGSERPKVPGAELIGQLEGKEQVRFTVLLRQRPGTPPPHDMEHWQATSPSERQYVSVEEFLRAYGASDEELATLIEFLKSHGLRVVVSDAGRRRVEVEGSAAEINDALGITLNQYRAPRRFVRRPSKRKGEERAKEKHDETLMQVYRGFDGPVRLPAKIVEVVTAVIGLDNRQLGGPALTGTGDPAGAQYLPPTTIAELYNFPSFSAAGQTVGLFEDAGTYGWAAYLHSDINTYIGSLPAGHNVLPSLTDISRPGFNNNASIVTGGPNPGNGNWGGVYECTLDVSVVAAVAQGANINVYFTSNDEAGWEWFFQRAIFPPAGDHAPSVLSASWINTISDDAGTIGLLSASSSLAAVLNGYLQSAALRGITVFMAIGDWGSANQGFDGKCHVSYPNSNPWLTSCGGTIIGTGTPPAKFDEWTWSDGGLASQFAEDIYVATGGGVSDLFPIPAYQTAAGVLPISKNDGNIRRGLPDVAGMVGMDGFFINGGGGPGQNELVGTSAVSPLYAGLVAMINGFLGHNVGFLNPTLYRYGPEICHDVKIGNNLPGYVVAPYYTAGIEWDPCTGWGSIDGFRLLGALAPAPIIETAIPAGGFGNVCVGSFADQTLTINNTGFDLLLIFAITSSSPNFLVPSVTSYPLAVSPGGSIDVTLRFQPSAPAGLESATLKIFSNDLFSPRVLTLSGNAEQPRLSLMVADSGNFGNVCVGSFADEPLVLNNSSHCPLVVTGMSSTSPEFLLPTVVSYPLSIAAGGSLPVFIRFAPTSLGLWTSTITVFSSDPAGARSVLVSGTAPGGKLAVTGSTCFGGVKACCTAERTISICNVGACNLHVSSVAFKRKSPYWKLINDPFPATLRPGSCLGVLIRYKAAEKCPRACELVITSDDPTTPVKVMDVLAYTIWSDCGMKCSCGGKCESGRRPSGPCCDECHDDCGCEEEGVDEESF
jgi:hypothetical protein